MYMFTFYISLHLAGFPSQYSSAHEYWCGISPGTSSEMNEDGPPAQTYLHKHGCSLKTNCIIMHTCLEKWKVAALIVFAAPRSKISH